MKSPFNAVKITDSVYWVGAIDWSIRDFHGYSTHHGTTYNAYLIIADKITLIDAVKKTFFDELMSRISSIVDPKKIDYIVSNHSELDHTGCLPDVIRAVNPEKVFASPKGIQAIEQHFHAGFAIEPVRSDDIIDLGGLHLHCLETSMLHWPDSMFTYIPERRLLFSQDAFGMHLASSERFADEVNPDTLEYESAKYFANILMPYSPLILKLIETVKKRALEIDIIAHDHGPIYRTSPDYILSKYLHWAQRLLKCKAIVVYDTMWQSTAIMANAITEGLTSGGVSVRQMHIAGSHRSDIATEILDSAALIMGSPTLNSNMFPSVADVMYYLKGLKPKKLISAAFGSYGWGGESLKQMKEILLEMGTDYTGDVRAKYVPDSQILSECFSLGASIAEKVKGVVK